MQNEEKTNENFPAGKPTEPVKPAPVDPEKNIPTKPDKDPDPTKIAPGIHEPEKNDPTRIKNPEESR